MVLRLLPCLLLALLALAAPASATPVKCAAGDSTPGDRVFPEPDRSFAFLRFDELGCGLKLLEAQHPQRLQLTTLGTSLGGRPLYDVLLTDETVPASKKKKLLVVSSIHGDEVGGREGGARTIEDLVDPRFLAREAWVAKLLDEFVVHFVFPNPDGWVAGDVLGTEGASIMAFRGNDNGRDLNRQFPVKGWIDTSNATLAEPEGNAVMDKLFGDASGWDLATDNHGQLNDTYAAAGLQIVGQFDFQKSERLARFADGITGAMKEYGVLRDLEALKAATGADLGAYHWGTLYDMLGYSASGSLIDHYNTADGLNGTGFATELTVGREVNWLTYPPQLAQVWTDSIRAINLTMFRQAIEPKRFTYEVGGRAGYVADPELVTSDDANGAGYVRKPGEDTPQRPYAVTRMTFFEDLNGSADRPLEAVRVPDVLSGAQSLARYDSLVLANDAMPEGGDRAAWLAKLGDWVRAGGNLVLTDGALSALPSLGLSGIAAGDITVAKQAVGFADFLDRTHPLNRGLRGVARQTYDVVPLGYAFGDEDTAPNWKVRRAAWEAAGGTTQATNGDGQTIYGEAPLGKGRVRVLGALLPDPTEAYYHPYGLQNYAVTYTGYTLLQNMLRWANPARSDAPVACVRRSTRTTLRITLPARARRTGVRVTVNGKRGTVVSRRGRVLVVRLTSKVPGRSRFVVRARGRLTNGTRYAVAREHRACR